MKPWMKFLMWFGVGIGFGYFIGDRVGYGRRKKEEAPEAPEEVADEEEAREAMETYSGGDYDGDDVCISSIESLDEILARPATDDDPDMPTEDDILIDPDIPQLHPQHLIPELIGEEEFNINIWHYDLEQLIFYEMDEVLYNETTQSIIENPDDVIGIGTLNEFGGDPNNPIETIYVKNDTFGTLFRIDRMDAAFCDAVDGSFPPEEDEPDDDDDDFNKDDYWNDV